MIIKKKINVMQVHKMVSKYYKMFLKLKVKDQLLQSITKDHLENNFK